MTTTAVARRFGFSGARRSRPEWWIAGVAAAGWVVVFTAVPADGESLHAAHHGTSALSWGAASAWWVAMVVAMMAPLAMPGAGSAARGGLRRRRGRATVLYLCGFLAIWSAFAAGVAAVQVAYAGFSEPAAAAGLAAVAALWQTTSTRARALAGCGRGVAIPASGWRSTAGTLGAGSRHGLLCVVTCWASMLIMVPLHHPLAMLGLFAVQLHERRPGPNPFAIRRRRPGAIVYGVVAVASLAAFAA